MSFKYALYCPDLKCVVISQAVALAPYVCVCVCAGLVLPPSLHFFPLFLPHSLMPLNPPLLPVSLSPSLSRTRAAHSSNRLGNGFISSNVVWSEAEPLTLSKRLPTAVMCFHTSQSTRPHRHTIFPHRRPPFLSLSLFSSHALYLFLSLTLPSSYSQTDSPFPLSPLPFCHPLLFFFTSA